MNDKLEERFSDWLDEEELLLVKEEDLELAAMGEIVARIREARVYEPPSFDFLERGWQHVRQRTEAPSDSNGRATRPLRKRAGWVAAAASILVVAVVFAMQPWGRSSVSAAEIQVTGGGQAADLGVNEAGFPRYAGKLDVISYTSGKDDQVILWDRADDKSHVLPLNFDYARDAAWSPDGKRMAFVGYRSALPGPSAPALWIAGKDGSGLVQVAKPADPDEYFESPAWSPDGTRIAFTATRATLSDETGVVYKHSVMTVNADGSGLSFAADGQQPAWSPDGKRLAYTIDNEAGEREIWTAGVNGADARKLVSGEMPSWSPTGPFLAFTKTRTEHRTLRSNAEGRETFGADVTYHELWAVNTESGTETRLTESAFPSEQIDQLLAESDRRGEEGAMYTVSGRPADEQPSWSPDGTRILFTRSILEEKAPHFTLQELFVDYK